MDGGLISKILESQYLTVFKKFDKDSTGVLSFKEFHNFVFSIGMGFLTNEYD
jgi:Ca2+-binding EF-hand superfamily protein